MHVHRLFRPIKIMGKRKNLHKSIVTTEKPITVFPLATKSKPRVCGRLLAAIVNPNPAGDKDMCVL